MSGASFPVRFESDGQVPGRRQTLIIIPMSCGVAVDDAAATTMRLQVCQVFNKASKSRVTPHRNCSRHCRRLVFFLFRHHAVPALSTAASVEAPGLWCVKTTPLTSDGRSHPGAGRRQRNARAALDIDRDDAELAGFDARGSVVRDGRVTCGVDSISAHVHAPTTQHPHRHQHVACGLPVRTVLATWQPSHA